MSATPTKREREPASDCSTYPNVALRVRCLEEGAHWLVEGRGKGGVCGCDANVAVGNGANDDAVVIKYGYSTDILLFHVKGGRGFARVRRAGEQKQTANEPHFVTFSVIILKALNASSSRWTE